jgi:uncharacterized membrane protein
MSMTPAIAIHLTAALAAVVIGPLALWARRTARQRPKLHRAAGYAWVTLMVITAVSAMFIQGGHLPNIHGYSPIHLLVPVVLFGLVGAFWFLARGNIAGHRKTMTGLYFGAGIGAGVFALLPDRILGQFLWGRSAMAAQILGNTPLWVWGLFVALLAVGLSQTRDRSVGIARIAALPVAMTAFSLWGTVSAFGAAAGPLLAWAIAAAALLLAVLRQPLPASVSYDAQSRQFQLPGSWAPMALILGIFLVKYGVGVTLAMQPQLVGDPSFALGIATLNGVFSGLFAGRAGRLLRLAVRPAVLRHPAIA